MVFILELSNVHDIKLVQITRPGLAIQKNLIFGHFSGWNSRSNSGQVFKYLSLHINNRLLQFIICVARFH